MKRIAGYLFMGVLAICTTPVQSQSLARMQTIRQTVTSLTRQIWRTYPDQRPLPLIEVVPRGKQPVLARFRPRNTPTLLINESLFDLCTSFGTDSLAALALVVGHELTHYQANHKDWLDIAQYRRDGAPVHVSPLKTDELMMLEAVADRDGTLHAFVAGYDGFRLIKPLYEKIYKTYDLPAVMPGYPAKTARIELSLNQIGTARQNALLVDAATFLFCIGQYDLAEPCLTAVVQQWPLAELQNNLAALYLEKALHLTTCREMPFRLPVEWNAYNRLLTLRQQNQESEKALLLEQAHTYANLAHRSDPNYGPATLNLAIVNVLNGNYGTADDLIKRLDQTQKLGPDATLVRAIAHLLHTKNSEQARLDFDHITGSSNESFNRSALAAWPACPTQLRSVPDTVTTIIPESGLGTYTFSLLKTLKYPVKLDISGPQYLELMGNFDSADKVDVCRVKDSPTTQYDMLKTTSSAYPTARGLRVGQTKTELMALYGAPTGTIAMHDQTQACVYPRAGLLVFIRAGIISQLMVYRRTV